MVKLLSTITDIGEKAESLFNKGMVILFCENAPKELAPYCVLHRLAFMKEDTKSGDILSISGIYFKITAVGSVANKNLKELGHSTLVFDKNTSALLPGHIHLETLDFMPSYGELIGIGRQIIISDKVKRYKKSDSVLKR